MEKYFKKTDITISDFLELLRQDNKNIVIENITSKDVKYFEICSNKFDDNNIESLFIDFLKRKTENTPFYENTDIWIDDKIKKYEKYFKVGDESINKILDDITYFLKEFEDTDVNDINDENLEILKIFNEYYHDNPEYYNPRHLNSLKDTDNIYSNPNFNIKKCLSTLKDIIFTKKEKNIQLDTSGIKALKEYISNNPHIYTTDDKYATNQNKNRIAKENSNIDIQNFIEKCDFKQLQCFIKNDQNKFDQYWNDPYTFSYEESWGDEIWYRGSKFWEYPYRKNIKNKEKFS